MVSLDSASTGETACSQLQNFLTQRRPNRAAMDQPQYLQWIDQAGEKIATARDAAPWLIWLDACDVQTTRLAVQLAQRLRGTVHVGQSTGSQVLKQVHSSEGWFGTTLSEVAARADLVITIGDGLVSQAPLLTDRFFQRHAGQGSADLPDIHWLQITPHSSAERSQNSRVPDASIHVPRPQWHAWFTELAWRLQAVDGIDNATSPTLPGVELLCEHLRKARYSAWLWDVDEFRFGTDELILRRLATIVRQLNESSRSGLLPVDLNPGRVTAEESLLWLTGCSVTASWDGRGWSSPERLADYSLEQWQAAFENILVISNVAGTRALPNLRSWLTLHSHARPTTTTLPVAAVGIDCAGHLFRGDRGHTAYLPMPDRTPKQPLGEVPHPPTATAVLQRWIEQLTRRQKQVVQ